MEEEQSFDLQLEMVPEPQHEEHPQIDWQNHRSQIVASISVSLVAMIVGYTNGYAGPAERTLPNDFDVTPYQLSWVGSITPLFAIAGGLSGGPLVQMFGRKWIILACDVLSLLSFLMVAYAEHLWTIYVARAVAGVGVALNNLTIPVYLAEIAQPSLRGPLVILPTVVGNSGIVLVYVAGRFLNWHELAWIGFVISIPFLILVFQLVESPVFYISVGKEEQAIEALKWLRDERVDLDSEFEELTTMKAQEQIDRRFDMKEFSHKFCSKQNLKPLLMVVGLMLFQQFSGVNAVIYYSEEIFKMSNPSGDKNLCSIIIGVVNVASSALAAYLVDKLGRKVLLFLSACLTFFMLSTFGAYFYIPSPEFQTSELEWLPVFCLVLYFLGFSLGYGPIPWLMMGELMPPKIRGPDAAVVTSCSWFGAFVVTRAFRAMILTVGPAYVFWFYAVIMLFSVAFILYLVPETRRKSLRQIEEESEEAAERDGH